MDALEDDNPFDQDGENITSETSSTSKLDLSEPPSPPLPSRHLSASRPFPSPGSHRQPQMSFKSDFCCTRDRVLHFGEDVEILVRELTNL
jgi:sorting nexin-41/42